MIDFSPFYTIIGLFTGLNLAFIFTSFKDRIDKILTSDFAENKLEIEKISSIFTIKSITAITKGLPTSKRWENAEANVKRHKESVFNQVDMYKTTSGFSLICLVSSLLSILLLFTYQIIILSKKQAPLEVLLLVYILFGIMVLVIIIKDYWSILFKKKGEIYLNHKIIIYSLCFIIVVYAFSFLMKGSFLSGRHSFFYQNITVTITEDFIPKLLLFFVLFSQFMHFPLYFFRTEWANKKSSRITLKLKKQLSTYLNEHQKMDGDIEDVLDKLYYELFTVKN